MYVLIFNDDIHHEFVLISGWSQKCHFDCGWNSVGGASASSSVYGAFSGVTLTDLLLNWVSVCCKCTYMINEIIILYGTLYVCS